MKCSEDKGRTKSNDGGSRSRARARARGVDVGKSSMADPPSMGVLLHLKIESPSITHAPMPSGTGPELLPKF